jgi:hypothetical protein
MSPADILDEWAERAAIMEHDGNRPREHAEAAAWARIAREHTRREMAHAHVEKVRRELDG